MQVLVSLLAALAVVPVVLFGTSIHSAALWSLLCVALIAGSLYFMFSAGETDDAPR